MQPMILRTITQRIVLLFVASMLYTVMASAMAAQDSALATGRPASERSLGEKTELLIENSHFHTENVGDVVSIIPAPSYYVDGLSWDGEYLWVLKSTGAVTFYKVDSDTGVVEDFFAAPSGIGFPRDITHDGTFLWCTNDIHDKIYKINPSTRELVGSIPAPGDSVYGIAWDGKNLWIGDRDLDAVYKIRPSDGAVLDSFPTPSPISNSYGLAWDGNNLWIQSAYEIYQVDPSTGMILASIDAPVEFVAGGRSITWDGTYLWWGAQGYDLYQLDTGSTGSQCDLNGDGAFSVADLRVFIQTCNGSCAISEIVQFWRSCRSE